MSDETPMSRREAREAAGRPQSQNEPTAPVQAPAQDSTPDPVAANPTQSRPALDDLFTGKVTSDVLGSVPPPVNKKRRRRGAWIALAIVVVLVGGVAAGGLWVWNTYEEQIRDVMGWQEPQDWEDGLATGEALVTIASNDTGAQVSTALYDAGVTRTEDVFYDMLIESGQNPTFYPGVYQLQQKMTAAAALIALEDPASKLNNSALLPEGLTVAQSLPELADSLQLPLEDFQAAVADPAAYGVPSDSLEGWLFPAMYEFEPGVTPTQVIQTMVNRTVRSLDEAGVPVEDRHRVLTIASIIQREARATEDFYKVSRVIENRLDESNTETFGLLQMDSTAQYGYNELHAGTASSSAEALADQNPWNTYVNTGLPIGPISNPGDTAIDAAMHPADGPWLYFVTVNLDTGETVFTETASQHEAAVEQWRAWCRENPDSGC